MKPLDHLWSLGLASNDRPADFYPDASKYYTAEEAKKYAHITFKPCTMQNHKNPKQTGQADPGEIVFKKQVIEDPKGDRMNGLITVLDAKLLDPNAWPPVMDRRAVIYYGSKLEGSLVEMFNTISCFFESCSKNPQTICTVATFELEDRELLVGFAHAMADPAGGRSSGLSRPGFSFNIVCRSFDFCNGSSINFTSYEAADLTAVGQQDYLFIYKADRMPDNISRFLQVRTAKRVFLHLVTEPFFTTRDQQEVTPERVSEDFLRARTEHEEKKEQARREAALRCDFNDTPPSDFIGDPDALYNSWKKDLQDLEERAAWSAPRFGDPFKAEPEVKYTMGSFKDHPYIMLSVKGMSPEQIEKIKEDLTETGRSWYNSLAVMPETKGPIVEDISDAATLAARFAPEIAKLRERAEELEQKNAALLSLILAPHPDYTTRHGYCEQHPGSNPLEDRLRTFLQSGYYDGLSRVTRSSMVDLLEGMVKESFYKLTGHDRAEYMAQKWAEEYWQTYLQINNIKK